MRTLDDYTLEYSITSPFNRLEPDDFTTGITGLIYLMDEDYERTGSPIGRLQSHLIVPEDSPFSWFDLIDSHSAENAEFCTLLDDTFDEFKEALADDFECCIGRLLILSSLKIDSEHRGLGLGLAVIRETIRLFGETCFVVMKPYPLDFTEYIETAEYKADPTGVKLRLKNATKKLVRYYGLLGFKRIPGTAFMGFNPDFKMPSVEAAMKKYSRTKGRLSSVPTRPSVSRRLNRNR